MKKSFPAFCGPIPPEQARKILNQFLAEANFRTLQRIAPGTSIDQQILSLSNRQLQQLINRISTGQEFVIRILSAANYVTGESCVLEGQEPCIDIFYRRQPEPTRLYPWRTTGLHRP